MSSNLSSKALRAAYLAQHGALLAQCSAVQRGLRRVAGFSFRPDMATLRRMRRRYLDLLERDLKNVEEGIYPRELLFQMPFTDYLKTFPRLVGDLPRFILRAKQKNFRDLPESVPLSDYPAYYRRNFHWQSDGYLSRRSAELYDIGVEFLFLGLADVMRRQVLPSVARFVQEQHLSAPRVLDVGCGTGSMLRQLAGAYPDYSYYGLDLSPYYIEYARERLPCRKLTLLADNAEYMPFRDQHFDIVTSVHLFHELPRNARTNVISEMARVLRPGGLLVIQDSAQIADGSPVLSFLERFADDFHEPFYRDYLRDDLSSALAAQGFEVTSVEPCFVAKVVTARRTPRALTS
jgi:ubiquinone/menaquinone biosynthesis C-methylase UbiE